MVVNMAGTIGIGKENGQNYGLLQCHRVEKLEELTWLATFPL